MATIRKSITFTDKLTEWMQSLVATGEYAKESEYVRDLVRKDRDNNAPYRHLKAAIDEGLESGVGSQNVDQIMKAVEDRMRKDGRL
ncbi:MAG: antitoxin ParD1/3/4 [Flavobacteriales bacterium]|jgi:antitoxin ParD1/3/4